VQPPVTRTIGLIQRSGRTLSPAAAAFVALLQAAQPLRPRRGKR
jgi:hypothetical protein